ncbi:antibiotic biosynthesis monooxygenase [Leptolyngbya sp. FACHB-261]|uniref:antibiotic biosynthesis monooxygenase family protein n=1 Tax=Leptolyngbya sp. FACHB-261 TaxID=2692806 RepID=UPI0016821AE2|nr:antibiotic biosynthesis monooxygenase [Leptolyngbya sp. FACHB-261]MBD2099591.1 antibiotic biosynthesis monooxygenase [Leptolyngbya sp. FACHB-261]
MIERRWHGKVPQHLSESFFHHLIDTGVRETIQISGNLGARILKNENDGWVHFVLVTFWRSIEDITAFAGQDISKAVLYPEDEKYELVPDLHVEHYEIVEDFQPQAQA